MNTENQKTIRALSVFTKGQVRAIRKMTIDPNCPIEFHMFHEKLDGAIEDFIWEDQVDIIRAQLPNYMPKD